MKILLVYPVCPETFWGFRRALRFISKKAVMPPLGLLTVASMLPKEWEKRLIDMNVTQLKDSDLAWADYVFVSAMVIQRQGVRQLIERCQKAGKKIVAGGPLFTSEPENFDDIDYLVLNEGEITLPQFLADLAQGNPKHIYTSTQRPDLSKTPFPAW
ncbi:MAG: cobalamin-dependent protein, partial [candidate division WOR-3 bacterium]|nr:cobalamin-dependent protein [candidate division WOR-3 bacterium]